MIYTVTFNPSLDYIVSVEDFKLGITNRTSSELMLPGGKGINVSTVLGNLELKIPLWDLRRDLRAKRLFVKWNIWESVRISSWCRMAFREST